MRTEVGELPEPGKTFDQAGDDPGPTEAADDGEQPARGGDLTSDIRHNLSRNINNQLRAHSVSPVCNKTCRTFVEAQIRTPDGHFLGWRQRQNLALALLLHN